MFNFLFKKNKKIEELRKELAELKKELAKLNDYMQTTERQVYLLERPESAKNMSEQQKQEFYKNRGPLVTAN